MNNNNNLKKEFLPGWNPTSKTQQLPGFNNELADVPLDNILPGGIGENFHNGEIYKAADKLKSRVALITGGDSGIGRSIAILYAMEGADVALNYLPSEQVDADDTKKEVEKHGVKCHLIPMDIRPVENCKKLVEEVINTFGHLEIVVNNAGVQFQCDDFADAKIENIQCTFETNILSGIYITKFALPHLKAGASIIFNASVNAFMGNASLCDYSATKGAIIGFVRSLAKQLGKKAIRVNAVCPGPIHTPLVQATFDEDKRSGLAEGPWALQRCGQPSEVATSFVFLASADSSYMTGQSLHPNGGYPC